MNKQNTALTIKLDVADIGAQGATAYIVDPKSVTRGAANGVREEQWKPYETGSYALVTLEPYAVVIATLNNNNTAAVATSVIV